MLSKSGHTIKKSFNLYEKLENENQLKETTEQQLPNDK